MKRLILILSLCIISTGCAKKQPPPPPRPEFFEHTVQYQGETLALIASWYTNTSIHWKEIADANPDLKPNRLKIGSVVLIPYNLIQQTEPLPKRIVKVKAPEPKKIETPVPETTPITEATPDPTAPSLPLAEQEEPPAEPTTAQEASPAQTPSAVVATPAVASSEQVKEDLLDEILNPKGDTPQ